MENEVNTSIDAVIGLILSNIRKNKKISQDSAAKYIGVTKQAISNMENTLPVKYCQRVVILFYFPIKSVQNSSHGTGLE